MSDNYISITDKFGMTAQLEEESLVVEPWHDDTSQKFVALADDFKRKEHIRGVRNSNPWPVTESDRFGAVQERYGWSFDSREDFDGCVDDYLRKRNVAGGIK